MIRAIVFLIASASFVELSAESPEGETPFGVTPRDATLKGPLDRLQLLVTAPLGDSGRQDLTHEAIYESLTPSVIRVDRFGRVKPFAPGRGSIRVEHPALAQSPLEVSVEVIAYDTQPSLREDVLPILSKAGCNQGACHAAQFGKGGLKLSLFGFAPEQDYPPLARDFYQRRVDTGHPESSLILRKPTQQISHEGGKRFEVDSYEYEVLKAWIAAGAPPPTAQEPEVAQIFVSPRARTYSPGENQQLRVVARYSDGSKRDVTLRARYDTLSEGVATVDPTGLVVATGHGQTAIMVRYQGEAEISEVLSPYADSVDLTGFTPRNFVDEHVKTRWQHLGLKPTGPSTDEEFIRRAFLDALGTLPRTETVERFLDSPDPNKRDTLIDEILGLTGDPRRDRHVEEWSTYWTLKWGDLLRVNRKTISDAGMWAFHHWIRQSLRENKSVDRFVKEILTARGSILNDGPANYFVYTKRPTDKAEVAPAPDIAETTAQVFLGIRMQCARCHHHPFETYSQTDYYGLAAFFTGITSKQSDAFGELGFDAVLSVGNHSPIKHPRTGAVVPPTPLLAEPANLYGIADTRELLADWITAPDNPFFARNIVNRIWGYFMGTAIVEPIDDLRATNPPSNPDLLTALAANFVADGYDLRKLMRTIMRSRVYQLSSAPRPENAHDTRFYAHQNVKRLPAEVLLDAIDFACGTHEKFPDVPLGIRAIELPDSNFESYFLDTLGRPKRKVNCECERTAEPNLAQVLHIANGDLLQRKLTDKNGRIGKLLAKATDGGAAGDTAAIHELYLATFSRRPTDAEVTTCQDLIRRSKGRREGLENILWALCNSREFLFNH